jgi:4-hydroxy-2-oxoheptanedioate aldolase
MKERLADGKAVVGCVLAYDAPWLVEMVGLAGYDFVTIDLEHEPFDASAVANLIRTADAVGLTPLVRMPCDDRVLPLLSSGAKGVQIPGVNDAAYARKIVETVRFAPLGRRTYYSQGRETSYGLGLDEDAWRARANDELIVIAMIEDIAAIDRLDEILAVDGIDAFHVGPMDLRESMGDPSPQDLQAAIDRILRRCRDAGKPIATGVITPWSIDAIAGQLAKGIQIFNVPSAWLIADAVATQLQAIEDVIPAELRERKATPVTRGAYGNTPETTGGSAGD